MTQAELIREIIPFVSENFVTFPLWEEGNYNPQMNMWRIFKTPDEYVYFRSKNFSTEDVDVYYDAIECPTFNLKDIKAVVSEDDPNTVVIEPIYDEIGVINYKVEITIYYHEEHLSLDLMPLLEVAARIARYGLKKD